MEGTAKKYSSHGMQEKMDEEVALVNEVLDVLEDQNYHELRKRFAAALDERGVVISDEKKLLAIMSAIIYTRTGSQANYGDAVGEARAILNLL